jgi:hypothetical protein
MHDEGSLSDDFEQVHCALLLRRHEEGAQRGPGVAHALSNSQARYNYVHSMRVRRAKDQRARTLAGPGWVAARACAAAEHEQQAIGHEVEKKFVTKCYERGQMRLRFEGGLARE